MRRSFPGASDLTHDFDSMRVAGMGLAAELVLKRRYNEARRVLTKILEFNPKDVEVMTLFSNLCVIERKLDEAEAWLKKVFSIDPNNPKAFYEMGTVYHEKGEFEKAIEMYGKAIQHFPENAKNEIADVYQNLGCSLWEAGRREEAIEAWKNCLKYNPKQKYAKKNLKEFTNEYGLPKSPVGMDDVWAFVDIKYKEYFSVKGKERFDDGNEVNAALQKIMDVWNKEIAGKYGKKLDRMKTKDKVKLFEETKVFA